MILYAMDAGYIDQYLSKMENATSEDKKLALEQFGAIQSEGIMTRENGSDTVSLNISGPLSVSGPSPLARFFGFGGTGYNEIISAAQMIANDQTINNVVLAMNTPGGTVEGMDEAKQALDALSTAGKVVTAENHGMIASAGYYMAMAANNIKAMSSLAVTGSIGVVVAGLDFSGALAANGIRKIKIVSKNAPNKQADPTTEKGQDIIQAQIDAMERVFISAIARGRGTTEADVISNFGKGGLLIAKDPGEENPDALSVGMVDSVVIGGDIIEASGEDGPSAFQDLEIVDAPWDEKSAIERVKASGYTKNAFLCYNSAEADGGLLAFTDMVDGKLVANIHGIDAAEEQLSQVSEVDRPKVQSHIERYRDKWKQSDGGPAPQSNTASSGNLHREDIEMDITKLKAEHPALFAEAVKIGADSERGRVEAHITMGEAAGDTALALENIKSGVELTPAINAKYMAANMNRNDTQNRADDNVDDIDTQSREDVDDKDTAVAKALAALTGVDHE